ncbi:MAG: DUF4349 domain-containing protein [Solirubrobacterales bacterium]|nr:DUF4349 domain-containing protein [Solirubrobacterales bacterium]
MTDAPFAEADAASGTDAAAPAPSAPEALDRDDASDAAAPAPPTEGDPAGIARGADRRIVDASARITLGADAGEVQDVANQVVEVTDRHHGIVSDSRVSTDRDQAQASLSLQIPHARLDAALGDLSALADVLSRTEATDDITARAVRARRELANTFDQLRRARIELIRADTPEQRLVSRARIDSLEATADAQRARLDGVKRQGRFATVEVEVTSSGRGSAGGGWSLPDAFDDAGHVLEVIGGVTLISLAVLGPLALIGALAWLIAARTVRLRRERALD